GVWARSVTASDDELMRAAQCSVPCAVIDRAYSQPFRPRFIPVLPRGSAKSCYRFYMAHIGFWDRVKMAWRILIRAQFANEVVEALNQAEAARTRTALPPERVHASALTLLAAFQREGRLIDFLQQEVAGVYEEDVGAAARIVHAECRKAFHQFFVIAPTAQGNEGAAITLPSGFDAQRIGLTGNVSGQPPFKGTLKHHGW